MMKMGGKAVSCPSFVPHRLSRHVGRAKPVKLKQLTTDD